jgi:hypothetical protein
MRPEGAIGEMLLDRFPRPTRPRPPTTPRHLQPAWTFS